MNIITSVVESMLIDAALERLTAEQQEALMTSVMRVMLDDMSIDPRSKAGIRMGFERGISQFIEQAYKELAGELKKVDPTPNGTYVNFMLRMYAKGETEFSLFMGEDFHDQLVAYEDLKNRNQIKVPFNDINQFKTIQEFTKFVEDNKRQAVVSKSAAGTAETVYEDNEVKIIIPRDKAASCRYGKGTRWCVSGLAANLFDSHNRKGPLYFLLPKQPDYPKEKYALHFATDNFVDDNDKTVSFDYCDDRFGGLVDKYFKTNQDYLDWVDGGEMGHVAWTIGQTDDY